MRPPTQTIFNCALLCILCDLSTEVSEDRYLCCLYLCTSQSMCWFAQRSAAVHCLPGWERWPTGEWQLPNGRWQLHSYVVLQRKGDRSIAITFIVIPKFIHANHNVFFSMKGNAIVLRFTYIVSQNGWLSLIVLCIIFIRLRLWAGMCWFSHSPCRGAIHDGLWRSQQWFCLRGWLDYRL